MNRYTAGLLALLLMLPLGLHAASAKATFAGGCFWCMEEAYQGVEGVEDVVSGYMGGHVENPTYYQVSQGNTGHAEVVQVIYDPEKISYEKLLEIFWHNVDPVDGKGQFCDRGSQYRTAIFYHDEEQRKLAEASKRALEASGVLPAPIATEITPASAFTPAEDYHQDYYLKNTVRYAFYKYSCGRAKRLEQLWGPKEG